VLATASNGVYTSERVNGIAAEKLKRWFHKGKGASEGLVKVADGLRDMIIFKQLNLMGQWPVKPGVDVIFCRNVVIYFDKPTQSVLFDRYANTLKENGHLFIGHSENLYKVCDRFNLLGKTVYQRIS
jgi:chemotaxis protein methyltransferase CheR